MLNMISLSRCYHLVPTHDIGSQYLLATSFKTLESLAHNLMHHLLLRIPISRALPYSAEPASGDADTTTASTSKNIAKTDVDVEYSQKRDVPLQIQIRKPAAIAFAKCPSIEMKRTLRDYDEVELKGDSSEKTGIPEPIPQPLIPAMQEVLPSASQDSGCAHDHDGPCGITTKKEHSTAQVTSSKEGVIAYIAIGTNLGDRIENINAALVQLPRVQELRAEAIEVEWISREEPGDLHEDEAGEEYVRVRRTSRLYESRPMYVLDQGEFINGVMEVSAELSPLCSSTSADSDGIFVAMPPLQIETNLPPLSLLLHLKRIENRLGRVKTLVNGPRLIDLDLTFYGRETVKIGEKGDQEGRWGVKGAGWLEVPHWAVGEREFVLRPLVE